MTILYAALAMIIQDIFEVLKIQADARNRGWLAGIFDSLMWLAVITTTTISVTALQSHNVHEKLLVIISVNIAHFLGQLSGVWFGKRFIKG